MAQGPEGRRVVGKEEIRAYRARQWKEFGPHVEPLEVIDPEGVDRRRFPGVAGKTGATSVDLPEVAEGGVPLHVLGGRPGGLLFQNLAKAG